MKITQTRLASAMCTTWVCYLIFMYVLLYATLYLDLLLYK
ncbi:hypothetical protein U9M48_024175 [Paspalum notatum var. saurae]|uniref:Uncharacterized protein n=1 Tax=Paspalum notatum var. saurae TaxID=547442 RepID=A0AAQ3TQ92_PASNO